MNHYTFLFVDIDGVLNRHIHHDHNPYTGIDPRCMNNLNKIMSSVPGLKIVLTSAWRYLILGQQMTIQGFNSMMYGHGLWADDLQNFPRTIVDHIEADNFCTKCLKPSGVLNEENEQYCSICTAHLTRGMLVNHWLENKCYGCGSANHFLEYNSKMKFAILDDIELGFEEMLDKTSSYEHRRKGKFFLCDPAFGLMEDDAKDVIEWLNASF